ncbi:hypothetical protein BX659_101119 [Orenia metallireducens]|jgi:hypothetical protein|uniref:Uncharacterized protein n=1 Tax=Orenia metallireducens TaxID=1413210 RepID=A0A285FZI9_9FIRM|nr:hypothetical protein BX659_101119 [Orenia metallireducens]SNY15641.1 hypothetical protein SAMN06265827_10371 [Orenia metallireducens]
MKNLYNIMALFQGDSVTDVGINREEYDSLVYGYD